jgi:hypothetical protein
MPLSTDNLVQSNTGSFEGTSGTVSLPANVAAGSAVVIFAARDGDGTTNLGVVGPSGFDTVIGGANTNHGRPYLFLKQTSAGSESSWTITTTGGSQQVVWAVFEMTGADMAEAFLSGEPNGILLNGGVYPISDVATVTTRQSPVMGPSVSYNVLALAAFAAVSTDTTVPVFSADTGGFFPLATVSRANATRAVTLRICGLTSQSLVTFQAGADVAPSSWTYALIVAFTAADVRHAPDIDACSGFEIGSATALTTLGEPGGGDGPPPWDGVVGTPAIVTTTARTGSYCLELSAAAAAECVTWTAPTPAGNLNQRAPAASGTCRLHVRFPSALPGADVELASVEAGSAANGVVIRYVSASSKIGVKVGTGTEVLSDAAVVADKWIGVDYFYDPRTTTHTFDWQVDYDATPGDTVAAVPQTRATGTGMTAAVISTMRLGWTAARTATVRYDDVVWASNQRKAYPIGDVNIRPLTVDTAGTPVVSGSAANFKVFTSNGGTMATFDATSARNALDDVPPTIGASADGVAQVTAASSEYVEVPMSTYDPAGMHSHRAARWYWAGWAASGSVATCAMKVLDTGAVVATIASQADHGLDASALIWLGGMHRGPSGAYLLDQAKVDALKFQFGFSNDATPDVGIHTALVELVTQPAKVVGVLEAEGGAFSVYAREDPLTQSSVSYLVTTPAGTRGATFTATIDGSDFSQYVGPNTTYEKVIGAIDISQVTAIGLYPDAS